MDSVKRRLVYVADENEDLVSQLTGGGTPPTRPSRFSRLHVSASTSSRSSSKHGVTPPVASPVPAPLTDELLIVSYDGNMIADGSGSLRCPRNYAEARVLRRELRKCALFLTQFMHQVKSSASSDESANPDVDGSSSSSCSSSSYHSDSTDDEDDESSGEESPRRRRRNGRSRNARSRADTQTGTLQTILHSDLSSMTVAALRDALRERGLPVAGNKSVLEERLRLFSEEETRAPPVDAVGQQKQPSLGGAGVKRARDTSSTSAPRSSGSGSHEGSIRESHGHASTRSSSGSPNQGEAHQRFSHIISPAAKDVAIAEPTRRSRSLWGALVNVGSRLFGPAPSSQSPHSGQGCGIGGLESDVKRRRSA